MSISPFAVFMRDLKGSLKGWRLWFTLGWYDILMRYRHTLLGPFWLTLSLGVFIATLGLLYSSLFNMEIEGYLQYIAAGIIVWTFISTVIIDSCNVFIDDESIIKQVNKPPLVYILRIVWRNLIIFLHNLPIMLVAMLVFLVAPSPVAILSVFGMALVVFTSVWVAVIIGFFSTRYRDVIQIVISVLQILFFATPVFWKPEMFTGVRRLIVEANPLYHFIEIVRAPLLGQLPSLFSYVYVIAFTLVGAAFTAFFYGRYRNRVIYWI